MPPSMMYPAAAMMPQYPFVVGPLKPYCIQLICISYDAHHTIKLTGNSLQAYFPPSSDSMMATGMMRDHNTSNYPPG